MTAPLDSEAREKLARFVAELQALIDAQPEDPRCEDLGLADLLLPSPEVLADENGWYSLLRNTGSLGMVDL